MRRDAAGLIICPNCNRHYEPELGERKTDKVIQAEFPNAKKYQREQLITGLCSDQCWNEYLGIATTAAKTRWTRYQDEYATEASSLYGIIQLLCPACNASINETSWKCEKNSEGELQSTYGVCDKCGVKLRIYND